MKINLKIFYVHVPEKQGGYDELKFWTDELQNVQTFEFSVTEQNKLQPLYYDYNSAFDLMIDDYEDDMPPEKKVPEALVIAREYAAKQTVPEAITASNRLVGALEFPQSLNTPVDFDF